MYICSFEEEQAGYLAGYAAVKDGYTSLGFLGGIAVPAVIRFGYGYVQGINAAAEEDGVDVNVKYYYGGQFYGDDSITALPDFRSERSSKRHQQRSGFLLQRKLL